MLVVLLLCRPIFCRKHDNELGQCDWVLNSDGETNGEDLKKSCYNAQQGLHNEPILSWINLTFGLLQRFFLVLGDKRSTGINWNLLKTFKGFQCNQCS